MGKSIFDETYAFEPFFDERIAVAGRRGARGLRLSCRACVLDCGAADAADGAVASTPERCYSVRVPRAEWVDATSPRRGDEIVRESGERLRVASAEADGGAWLMFANSKGVRP